MRKGTELAGVLIAFLFMSACGSQALQSETRADVEAAQQPCPVAVSGGTPAEQASLQVLVAEVDCSSLKSVRIGPPDSGFDVDGRWLYVTIPPKQGPEYVASYWRGLLVAGAYRDASAAFGFEPVRGISVAAGTTPLGAAVIEGPNPHPAQSRTEDIEGLARANLGRLGLELVKLEFVQTDLPALVVEARTQEPPASFLSIHPSPALEVFGELDDYAGTYLEILGSDDRPILASAYVPRVAQGVGWLRPDLILKQNFNPSDVEGASPAFNPSDALESTTTLRRP